MNTYSPNDLTIKDFIIHYTGCEYNKLINITCNLIEHIEKLYNDNILLNNHRIEYINKIDDILKNLILIHNQRLIILDQDTSPD